MFVAFEKKIGFKTKKSDVGEEEKIELARVSQG